MNFNNPYSPVFGEHYWSQGAPEKAYVFLGGNDLEQRFAGANEGFAIGELGFGTGLTFLLAWELWEKTAPAAATLHYYSYEMYPLGQEDMAAVHERFPALLADISRIFLATGELCAGWNERRFGRVVLHLYIGDAQAGLATQTEGMDAWFLDGFSPANNPAMWTDEVLERVGTLTKAGGTASTYSVARCVRDGLTAAGFEVAKVKGFPPKWQMLKATKL